MQGKKKQISWYIFSDFLFAIIGCVLFSFYLQPKITGRQADLNLLNCLAITFTWLLIFGLSGTYQKSLYEKSRLNEITETFIHTAIGSLIIIVFEFWHDTSFFALFLFFFSYTFHAFCH